ncbi:hypothetical protein [Azospirillum isscasi]|uniref:Uncharacterized protein n=1 Tax=Azospirillum isscasi TaxID=3053926 RepID=A0ABU0WQU9_9PROT|nr:hypothetical protein [Azospirillum isscasi]MDQ2106556.1 hypothetical protein [Azospirillum isscasi]
MLTPANTPPTETGTLATTGRHYRRAADVPDDLHSESRWRALGRRIRPDARATAWVDGYPCGAALYPVAATEPLPPKKRIYGETVPGCRVVWRDSHDPGPRRFERRLARVAVTHVGKNLVEWTRPRCGRVVRARLTGSWLEITAPDGRNLVLEWRQLPPPPRSVAIDPDDMVIPW